MSSGAEIVYKYFDNITPTQKDRFNEMLSLYQYWNEKINLISRKDFSNFYLRHVLHSLALTRVISFAQNTRIIDVGTGGGFPGIPLAIMFSDAEFVLIDSVAKKVRAVSEIAAALSLKNVITHCGRAEAYTDQCHFITARALAPAVQIIKWTKHLFSQDNFNTLPNGWLMLKGGCLDDELRSVKSDVTLYSIYDFFQEDYFREKWVVYVAARSESSV